MTMLRKPDFIVAGCAKCGTTFLHAALGNHPGLFLTQRKALMQFDRPAAEAPPIESYLSNFSKARPNQIAGESTPSYSYYPGALERIRNEIGPIKIILLIRNPIQRALSDYWMQVRKCRDTLPLREAMARRNIEDLGDYYYRRYSYIERSSYSAQIERAKALFGGDQVLVLRAENLRKHAVPTVNEAIQFLSLNLPTLEDIHVSNKAHNQGKTVRFSSLQKTLSWTHASFVRNGLLLPARIVELASKANFRTGGHTDISAADHDYIRDILLERDPGLTDWYPELGR